MSGIFDFSTHGNDPVTKAIFTIAMMISCLTAATTCVSPAKAETMNAPSAVEARVQTHGGDFAPQAPDPGECDALTDRQTDAPQPQAL